MTKLNLEMVKTANNRGFTLVELLIVITILGILAAVAAPSYRSFVAGQRIKNASFDVMAMLAMTRSEAIKRNATVTATPNGSSWAQGWAITVTGGVAINQQSSLPGISVTCSPACSAVAYQRNGRTDNSQSIQITGDGAPSVSRCISIDPSGRPNSKKGNC